MVKVHEAFVDGKQDLIATMRNKERVIRPLLQLTLGLPCAWCGVPTNAVRQDVSLFRGAGTGIDHSIKAVTADREFCSSCNP